MNRFFKNDVGSTAVEYGIFSGLIASLIVTCWVTFTIDFNNVVDTIITNLI